MVCSSFPTCPVRASGQYSSVASALRHAPQRLEKVRVLRKTARAVFRVDEDTVSLDIEYATAALDELRLHAKLARNVGRQTGGPRQIVSLHTVLDGNVHRRGSVKVMIIAERELKRRSDGCGLGVRPLRCLR